VVSPVGGAGLLGGGLGGGGLEGERTGGGGGGGRGDLYIPAAHVSNPTEGTSTVLPWATFIGKWGV